MSGSIKVKRVYEPPHASDGTRILVDRLWPRGLTREATAIDRWLKEIAPSNELRKWFHAHSNRWQEFVERYRKELSDPASDALLGELAAIASAGTLTLLYAKRGEAQTHAHIIAEMLRSRVKPS
jgi:uncharacterized protein YeaO (DUF488 family)